MDAIYARQSIDKKDSLSIQGQIDLCRGQVGEDVKIYKDKGYSGKNTNRPDFQRMMQDVEHGLIQKIVVYRLDRFSRSIADFGRLWEILKAHGVEFVSINETFDTSTPMGRAMLNIIMVFAQLERETTAARVKDNYYQRTKLGAWPGGPPPLGFTIGRLVGPTGSKIPTLIPNDDSAIIERIFHSYAQEEETLGTIARSLNDDHIPAVRRETWDSVAISRILHSPLYVMADEDVFLYYKAKGLQIGNPAEDFDGIHAAMMIGRRDKSAGKYQDVKDQHLFISNHIGIIPSSLWLTCQYKLDLNQQVGNSGRGKHSWLSGLMKCASCGYSVKLNKDGDKYYLICSGRSNLKLCHQSIHVNIRELEDSVASEIEALLNKCPETAEAKDSGNIKEIEGIDQKIDRLMDALAESNDLSMAYINRTIERLAAQREKLVQEQSERKAKPKVHFKKLSFKDMAFEQKKLTATSFIREIRLSYDSAEVLWNI